MKFLVLPELRGRWSWELRDAAGNVVAGSAMSFGSREAALSSVQLFRVQIPVAPPQVDEERALSSTSKPAT